MTGHTESKGISMDQNSMDEFFRMVGFDPDKQGGSSGKTGSAGNVYDVDASEPESVGGDTGGNGRRRKRRRSGSRTEKISGTNMRQSV